MLKINMQKKHRDSNIELFRIITMLAIIAHHYVVNSGLPALMYKEPLNSHSIFLFIFGEWGKIGINCFVFITGYFMCKSNITVKKFAKLLFEILFYNILISSIFWISGYSEFSLGGMIRSLIPIHTISDDFAGCYLIFFLLIPFLNILLKNITEKQHLLLIILLGFTYVFLGSVPVFDVTMNYVSWFIVLYVISSYIRLYPKMLFDKLSVWLIISIICVLSCVASIFVMLFSGYEFPYYFVTDSNKLLALATGLSLFLLFKNIKIPYIRIINVIASSTFGVLLIHANCDTMRRWLWVDVLNNFGMYNSPYLYVHAIVSVLVIFAICVIIDQMRIHFVEKPFFVLWDKYFPSINYKFKTVEIRILTRLKINK